MKSSNRPTKRVANLSAFWFVTYKYIKDYYLVFRNGHHMKTTYGLFAYLDLMKEHISNQIAQWLQCLLYEEVNLFKYLSAVATKSEAKELEGSNYRDRHYYSLLL